MQAPVEPKPSIIPTIVAIDLLFLILKEISAAETDDKICEVPPTVNQTKNITNKKFLSKIYSK